MSHPHDHGEQGYNHGEHAVTDLGPHDNLNEDGAHCLIWECGVLKWQRRPSGRRRQPTTDVAHIQAGHLAVPARTPKA
jgi:hypothetical protein